MLFLSAHKELKRPLPRELTACLSPERYKEACLALAYECPELIKLEFEEFCLLKGIQSFDREEVRLYMTEMAKKNRKLWGWMSLASSNSLAQFNDDAHESWGWWYGQGLLGPYQHLVPIEVLETAGIIRAKYPEANFHVATLTDRQRVPYYGDPFMGVTLPGHPGIHIFAVWNEPGFTKEP